MLKVVFAVAALTRFADDLDDLYLLHKSSCRCAPSFR
jgi:hypothetical protein